MKTRTYKHTAPGVVAFILAVVLAGTLLFPATVFAAPGAGQGKQCPPKNTSALNKIGTATGAALEGAQTGNPGYIDADGDGICDNYGTQTGRLGQGYGNGACQGLGYTDADGDGICDYYGTNGCLHNQYCGYGVHQGGACVDSDGDGVCDIYASNAAAGASGSGQGTAQAYGYGAHHGHGGQGHGYHGGR